ncbi:helix-turn-helix domain-containing protein [Lactobacillus sp. ESL0791]
MRTINSAEKGNGNISIETFLKLAKALGKHVSLNFY